MMIDWKTHLKEYHTFLQWDEDEEYNLDIDKLTQKEAKRQLYEDLDFIIGINGSDLFETERYYMQLLRIEV